MQAAAAANRNEMRDAEARVAQFADAVATFFHSVEEKGWTKVLRPFLNKGIEYSVKTVKSMLEQPAHEDV